MAKLAQSVGINYRSVFFRDNFNIADIEVFGLNYLIVVMIKEVQFEFIITGISFNWVWPTVYDQSQLIKVPAIL